MKVAFAALLLLAAGLGALATDDKIVCYFSSWAVWRPGLGQFDVEDIDPFLCTHIIFSFTGLSNHTWEIEVLDPWNELCPDEQGGHRCAFERAVALKKENPALVVMVAIGGWNEGSEDYSVMAADPWKRTKFLNSVVRLINKYGFDGLDFDWEYPAARGGVPEDKENFVTLVKEMRTAFDSNVPRLLISAAFAAGKETIDNAYYIPSLVDLFDLFHIMAYDYHGAWEDFTHHNSPLCGHYLDYDEFLYFNVKFTVEYYLDLGVPKEKFVLGTATYGRCYILDNFSEHGVWAKASRPGPAGPYIRLPGTLGYNEICRRLNEDRSCTVVHDPALHEPYFYCMSDYIWCSYDDVDSLTLKARYAKNMGLAGMMVWQIDTDDFRPECSSEPFPLINALKRAFAQPAGGDMVSCDPITPVPPSTTTTTTSTTTTTPTTTTTTTTPTTTTTTTPTTTTTTTTTTTPTTTTTTTTPTTTTTTTTPTTTTTTTPTTTTTTTPTTTTTSTAAPLLTTTPGKRVKPDCRIEADGTTFPHPDCNKYWKCASKSTLLELCAPGTLYDEILQICNWEGQVDTSECRMWFCDVDNTYYPAVYCNEYYWCYKRMLRTCRPARPVSTGIRMYTNAIFHPRLTRPSARYPEEERRRRRTR
ncbi:acidic mammalian chitinase-like [Macrobrachium nipponense]|uniref:acidic mammalian chitinase-like n=1 Tax=Macrobrachium nipponense TaxID=159736 RepID=UPI0030C8B73C